MKKIVFVFYVCLTTVITNYALETFFSDRPNYVRPLEISTYQVITIIGLSLTTAIAEKNGAFEDNSTKKPNNLQ
jgi:hypothetical protein